MVMDRKKLSVYVTASCTWLRILLTKRQWNCCLKPFIVSIMKTWYINYTGRTVPTSRSMMLSVVLLNFALTTKPSATENNCENARKWWSVKPTIHRSTFISYHWSQSTCHSILRNFLWFLILLATKQLHTHEGCQRPKTRTMELI